MRKRSNAKGISANDGGKNLVYTADRSKQQTWGFTSTRARAFVLATGAFIVVLIIVYSLKLGAPNVVAPIADDDIVLLDETSDAVRVNTTIVSFSDLIEVSNHVGCSAALMLERLVAAEEDTDAGTATQAASGNEWLPAAGQPRPQSKAVLRQYKQQLERVAAPLSRSADVAYERLKQMLRMEEGRVLPLAAASLPRTVFGWLASTVHLYSAVIPEYSLLKDDSSSHAKALLRSINLLSWGANHPHLFNWTSSPCHRSVPGVTNQWLKFCETSLSSLEATATRRAASFEELIALFPNYAPFRLHHAILLILRETTVTTPTSALRLIRKQEEKLPKYEHVDTLHRPLLSLLEAFATPVEQQTGARRKGIQEVLSTSVHSCEALAGNHKNWPPPFEQELRPALFDKNQLQLLFVKLRLLLGPQLPPHPLEGNCLDD